MSKRPAEESLDVLDMRDGASHILSKRARVTQVNHELEEHDAHSAKDDNDRTDLPLAIAANRVDGDDKEADNDLDVAVGPARHEGPTVGFSDLYLDTVNRALLDFDFEKLCSISLSNINVYACLICGKYFQGRGRSSHAYTHSLDQDHHVFINIGTLRVYVLPESYEVKNPTLDDIKYVVNPTYTKADVVKLDRKAQTRLDLNKRRYNPGFVGLNNIKQNDYHNVVVHALAHVLPLRNYFMLENLSYRSELAQRFSTLVRKIWNPRAFKSHVSPHELLQEISIRSNKRFTMLHQSDPVAFLTWFLNNLHLAVGGTSKIGSSIIHKVFQGKLRVEFQTITAKADASDRLRFEESENIQSEVSRFMLLTLDLPPKPIFSDESARNIIPQIPLTTILGKYDGLHPQELLGKRKRYRLLHPLPPFLIFHIKRFGKNRFVEERNPTIVTFTPKALDMSPFVEPSPDHMGGNDPILYDLVANVTHETVVQTGKNEGELKSSYKVQLLEKAREQWVQIQDLFVEEVARELIFTSESYIQIWERRR